MKDGDEIVLKERQNRSNIILEIDTHSQVAYS